MLGVYIDVIPTVLTLNLAIPSSEHNIDEEMYKKIGIICRIRHVVMAN